MDQLTYKTKNQCGPFETWHNPVTGEEAQFVTFPVVDGRITPEVTLGHEEHGQYMEWTFRLNNIPETTPETVTMGRKAATPQVEPVVVDTAVPRRVSPRFFVATYVVIALAIVAAILLRFN